MLEFSDAPYQFFEPQPSSPVIWLGRKVNQHFIVPRKNHLIQELRVEGALDEINEARTNGDRLVFVINHPSHSDPQVISEVHRQLGIPSSFMAAYDVFLRSKLSCWVMQKCGHFSIDREGSDRKAMSTAIDMIKGGDFALNIYPEGNVYLTNDRVTPFLDGTAFIALKAQKDLKDTARVKVIPISLKFTHLTAPKETVTERMIQLARDCGYQYPKDVKPLDAVFGLGNHIVSNYLRTHGYKEEMATGPEGLYETLTGFTNDLVAKLEGGLSLEASPETDLVDRIRKIRSKIHQLRTDEKAEPHPEIDGIAEKAILVLRIHGYLTPYLSDKPTIDRYDETVERIAEDYYSKAMPRTGPRRCYAQIHSPLDVQEYMDNAGGKLRDAVASLTCDSEKAVQKGIDDINEKNDTSGAWMVN
ncbi:MAG: hypothetical protein CMO55_16380 [Verrucomicrobiales bacterium]|nr:hypothetical protein [Verrucomicrobiales bacterium]